MKYNCSLRAVQCQQVGHFFGPDGSNWRCPFRRARRTSQSALRLLSLTQLGLDRLPYTSTRSISEICSRRCEPVHIDPARVVPPSSGALQRGREKCVPSFLSSPHPRPSSQLAQPRSQLASIGIACKATTLLARAIVNSPATRNVRLLHRAARPPARLILISRRPILISRPPLSGQFLQGSVIADAECVTSKIRWLGPLCICLRRESIR